MNDQNPPKQDSTDPGASPVQTQGVQPLNTSKTPPYTADEFHEVEREMNSFERATLRWARTAVVMSGLAAIFVCAQWYEMHTGGKDTHALAEAAGNQATWTQNLAGFTSTQSDRTKDLADQMKLQADRTKELAEQAVIQSKAARSSAETATRQLEATERPWLKVVGAIANHPVIFHHFGDIKTSGTDYVNLGIKVIVQNVGNSVALDVVTRADLVFVSMENGARNNPFDYPLAMQKRLCSKPDVIMPINLYPGEDNRDQPGDDHDVPTNGNSFYFPNDKISHLIPVFVGCVDYKIGNSGKVHQSGFIYTVMKDIPGQEFGRTLVLGEDVPMTGIKMERFAFGGFRAN